jgi:hypothetical protein
MIPKVETRTLNMSEILDDCAVGANVTFAGAYDVGAKVKFCAVVPPAATDWYSVMSAVTADAGSGSGRISADKNEVLRPEVVFHLPDTP